jgi:hypothetical protein
MFKLHQKTLWMFTPLLLGSGWVGIPKNDQQIERNLFLLDFLRRYRGSSKQQQQANGQNALCHTGAKLRFLREEEERFMIDDF